MICDQVTSGPVFDPERRLWTSPHAMPGRFVVEAHCGEAGTSVDWFAGLIGVDHAWMDEAAAAAPPGAGGVCFLDAAPNVAADFTLVRTGGLSFPVPVLALGRSREDVVRSILEGIAFAATGGLRWLFEVGGEPSEVAVGGGMARMRSFVRIVAAALARPVRRARGANASALGAAILAAAGAGAHADVASAVAAMSDRGEIVEPDSGWIEPTRAAYATWRERMDRVEDAALRVGRVLGGM
jgi:sugar (pentulose or hexulose) kinase